MSSFAIVSVWYHKNEFVFNTLSYPFLHNIQYHATKYNYVLLYLIEDETNITLPKNDNVIYINFKTLFNMYMDDILKFKHKSNKIDFIKNTIIKECQKINYDYILCMDMDCEIINIDTNKILHDNKFITFFYDTSIKTLKEKRSTFLNSYIENYAFLINKNNLDNIINFKNEIFKTEIESNCFIYEQFVNFVINYYKEKLKFIFPDIYSKQIELPYQPITIKFERGGSWFDNNITNKQTQIIYNMNKKPIYKRDKHELYISIIYSEIEEIIITIKKFIELEYDFKSCFHWSNSLQSYVNLYGVLIDRIDNIKNLNEILKLDFHKNVIKFKKQIY